ncbi:hypothetical protein M405DRAFT_811440 [Rhizopogon salebrosus TDB-379]|nr:hypothetical protein M405DRAFT_811440 [Rhizopogon salebrosus TDB-379]
MEPDTFSTKTGSILCGLKSGYDGRATTDNDNDKLEMDNQQQVRLLITSARRRIGNLVRIRGPA